MLGVFKRLWHRESDQPRWADLSPWAAAAGRSYRVARQGAGFIVEGRDATRPWRLEWGPSQRDYLVGREVRLRMDLDLPQPVQMLILSRELMRAMESETFERYTDHLKTHIDASTPEEMRWLVMFQKLSLRGMPTLRGSIGAVASSLGAMSRWLDGPLAESLEHETLLGALVAERPFVLMVSRHRLSLRVELFDPKAETLDALIGLFECAASRLPEAMAGLEESNSQYPATVLSGWLTDLPGESLGGPLSRSFGASTRPGGGPASRPGGPSAAEPGQGPRAAGAGVAELGLGLLRAMGRHRKVPTRPELEADTVTHVPQDAADRAEAGDTLPSGPPDAPGLAQELQTLARPARPATSDPADPADPPPRPGRPARH